MRGEFGAGGAGGRGGGGTRVYVGGLDGEIKKEDIEYEFEKFGKLNSVWVAYNPPGFAFVEFAERRDAQAACDAMNNAEIMGARLRVELSRGRGRGRGGGRGGGFGRDEGGRGGGFRGGRGGDRGRGSSRGSGFRGGSGRGGFMGDSYRSRERDGGRDGPPPRSYSGGGSGSYSATREPRFRSRSPHRFSSSGSGGTGSTGRREYGGAAGESFGRGGYQRNSYSRGGGY